MVREVYDALSDELDIIFVLDMVDFLLVVHDKERLWHIFFSIILDIFAVGLNGYQPRPCQLEYFFLRDLICLLTMELDLVDLLSIARAFCKENELVVAAHKMPPEHDLRLANDFKDWFVQRCLHDAVIVLNDEHVLLIATQRLGDQLSVLNLVVIEASTVSLDAFLGTWIDRLAILVLRRYLEQATAEDEQGLLVDIRVRV